MPVSRRLRFEILRRDNHTCRYCGATAPDVPLTVDHVIPIALGGSDDPSNLAAACKDCNLGKSSIAPDSPIVADVDNRAWLWGKAMEQAAAERHSDYLRTTALEDRIRAEWDSWSWTDRDGHKHRIETPNNWRASIRQFIAAGLTLADCSELIEVAMTSHVSDEWTYFCGCCWKRVREHQARAAEILADGDLYSAT